MAIWLQFSDKFDLVAELDAATGDYVIRSRKELGAAVAPPVEKCGSYAMLSGVFAALYAYEGRAFFRLGEKVVELTDDVAIEVTGERKKRTLVVRQDNAEIIEHEYRVDESKIIPGDITPFIDEEEEFDFGLHVSNVFKNADRMAVLLGKD